MTVARSTDPNTPVAHMARRLVRLFAVLALVASAWWIARETTWAFVWDSGLQIRDLADRMTPPDLTDGGSLLRPLLATIHIATLGTIAGVLCAVPLAIAAARRTSPWPAVMRPVAQLLLIASRSINALIWALILVVVVGPGTLAGVCAIALRSVGFIGRLLYEAIEEASEAPIEAMVTTGASRSASLAYGLVPQVAPTFYGIVVYRWEINIREATVIGLVGAGGIGMMLQASIDALAWSRVSTILLLIIATVWFGEVVSARIRGRLR